MLTSLLLKFRSNNLHFDSMGGFSYGTPVLNKEVTALAIIQPELRIMLDPLQPVPEICAVMMAVISYQPEQEEAILHGIGKAIEDRRAELAKARRGAETDDNK